MNIILNNFVSNAIYLIKFILNKCNILNVRKKRD